MSVSSLWIVAEPADGSFTTTTLELLSHARSLSSSISIVTWGAGASLAAQAGEFGATTLYDVGDLGGALPGAPVAAAIAALVAAKGAPDAILIPTSYDGRDVAGRLSARLDRPVLTNVTGLVDDDGLTTEHPVLAVRRLCALASPARVPALSRCARSPSRLNPRAARPRPWSPLPALSSALWVKRAF